MGFSVISLISVSFSAIFVQISIVVKKVDRLEKHRRSKVGPQTITGRKTLKAMGQRVIDARTPVAARQFLEYVRETFGASSTEYRMATTLIKELSDDKIHQKSELVRRTNEIFKHSTFDQKRQAYILCNELWLVD